MLKSGNSRPDVCVLNLFRTVRGEVPYERTKGINGKLIDKPSAVAVDQLTADTIEMLEVFEPRVKNTDIQVKATLSNLGYFDLQADTKGRTT